MPMRPLLPLTLFSIAAFWLCSVLAVSAREPINGLPEMSDEEVVRALGTADALAWERAREQIRVGRSNLASGKRLVERPPSPFRQPADVARDRADGRVQIERGEAMIKEGEREIERLRQKAKEAVAAAGQVTEAVVIPLDFPPLPLGEALREVSERLLFTLWNKGYGRIYLDQIYTMDPGEVDPVFLADPELGTDLRRVITRLDGNRFTFVNDETPFELAQSGSRAILDFPGRAQVLRNFQTVVIVGELVADFRTESAFLALRGMDLASMLVVGAEVVSVRIDSQLRQQIARRAEILQALALTENDESATEETSTEAAEVVEVAFEPVRLDGPEVSKRLIVQLRDNQNFIDRVGSSGTRFIFNTEYLGDSMSFNARVSSNLSKVILVEHGIGVTELDFLPLVMGDPEADHKRGLGSLGTAVWRITPLSSGRSGRVDFDLEAMSLLSSGSTAIPVGLLQTVLLEMDKSD